MESIQAVLDQVNRIVLGKSHQIRLAVACMLAKGHLLIEDVPGMGKTTLSHALATSVGLSYKRIQFTSDMLPADIIGVSIFDKQSQQFHYHQGPLFSQVLLADEINRASPKTQSALLEAMEERQVSAEGKTMPLPDPFFVIATQNPLHHSGTFPLPESQLDRFLMRISLGYPDRQAEMQLLAKSGEKVIWQDILPCMDAEQLTSLQLEVNKVSVSEALLDYVLRILHTSREENLYPNPLSPRAGQALVSAARAWALLHGRDFVLPEDVQAVFVAVVQHRLQPDSQGHASEMAQRLLASVDPVNA